MARTDTHRPSVIDPSEYQFVSFHDHRDDFPYIGGAELEAFHQHREATGGKFSDHDHGGVCHICGNANAMSVARFWHQPTNTYIEVGETCADKLHDGDAMNFASFRKRVKAGLDTIAGKRKAEQFLIDAGVACAYDIWLQKDYDNWGYEEEVISDIVTKLVRYGSISEKQEAFLAKLVKQIDSRAEVAAQREAEKAAAAPIPAFAGRATIEGEIVSRKWVESFYGGAVKITIKHADGWKVYGTEPSSIEANVGDSIRFDAAITVSDDDTKFGFFKRPTKAEIVEAI